MLPGINCFPSLFPASTKYLFINLLFYPVFLQFLHKELPLFYF